MFRKLDPDSELGKQISAFILKNKEGENMTKKFTEAEYQKIVDCFDRLNNDYNLGLMNDYLIRGMQHELDSEFDLVEDWAEIIAISNPRTRQRAHDQFVKKEKKYHWKSKKIGQNGIFKTIIEDPFGYPTDSYFINARPGAFTESEIREWGYNPDMFDREEVD